MSFLLVLDETEEIFNMIVPNAGMNFPMKRKIPGIKKITCLCFLLYLNIQ
jgi:hypothetical protein